MNVVIKVTNMGSENSKIKTNSTEKDAQAKLTEGIVNEIVWEMTFETRNRTVLKPKMTLRLLIL